MIDGFLQRHADMPTVAGIVKQLAGIAVVLLGVSSVLSVTTFLSIR